MSIRPIRSEADLDRALAEVERYFINEPMRGTPDADRFDVLCALIEHYEAKHHAIGLPDPIDTIRVRMEAKDLTCRDLIRISGVSQSRCKAG